MKTLRIPPWGQLIVISTILLAASLYLLPSVAPVFRGVLALSRVPDETILIPRQATVAFSRSLGVALTAGLISTCFALLTSRLWHLSSSAQRKVLIFLVLLPLFVPETAHALAFAGFISDLGFSKSFLTGALALSVFAFPFATVIFLLAGNSISPTIWAASRDLGLSLRERMTSVIIPLLWPPALVAFMVASLLSFNETTRTAYTSSRQMYSTYLAGAFSSGGRADIYSLAAVLFIVGVAALAFLSWLTSRRVT